jgi:hypothetical protein
VFPMGNKKKAQIKGVSQNKKDLRTTIDMR